MKVFFKLLLLLGLGVYMVYAFIRSVSAENDSL